MADPKAIAGLLAGGWSRLAFAPFRDGIEMCRLAGDPDGASMALLRYAAGARVPLHEHPGLETVLVLDGTQSDERGTYKVGDLVLNPAGSRHSVWSTDGCVVLIQWEKPVRFVGDH